MSNRWPARLWIVRHGESAGNVARDRADAAGLGRIDIAMRDVEVPLSHAGRDQALALGAWLADQPEDRRPQVLLASPYLRARHTAELIAEARGVVADTFAPCIDERLREREFGVLDRLTRAGILEHFPEEAERRTFLGKFYHRPPGGESWADVILRLRSMLDTLSLHHEGQRVLIVCHQVVVLCLRYLLENLDETAILAIDAEKDVSNCGVTEYEIDPDSRRSMRLVRYNFVAPLREAGAPVTSAPDANVAAR